MGKDSYFCHMKNDHLIFVPEVDSTINYLSDIVRDKELNHQKLAELTAVFTDWQSAGRGQQGNVWASNPKENILISFYFSPSIIPQEQFFMNIFFSLSVRKMLEKYLPEVKIKWPNDIYVEDKKIAGILLDHTLQNNRILHTIAGVGININQMQFPDTVANPTSLKLLTEQNFELLPLIEELHAITSYYYNMLKQGNYLQLLKEYYQNLYRINEYHSFIIHNEEKEAKILGINQFGQLQLEDRHRNFYQCGMKEINYRLSINK